MMWIDIGIILFLTLRTTLIKPGERRWPERGHGAYQPVREDEENLLRQKEIDGCSLFAEVLNLQNQDGCNYIFM